MMVIQKCKILHLGTHWFNSNAITNTISLADISEMFRVTMDTEKEKALIVHKVKFSEVCMQENQKNIVIQKKTVITRTIANILN